MPEIAAVIDDALGAHPVVVGHSFGGYMTMSYAAKTGANLSGVVIVDAATFAEYGRPRRAPHRL